MSRTGRPWARLAAAVLVLVVTGCAAPRREAKKDPEPPVRTVSTGKLLIAWTEPGPDGRVNPVLEVEAASGVVEQGTQSGSLQTATGRIYRKGVLQARFAAPAVEADMAAQRLVATGGVKVTSVAAEGLTLKAQRIEWRPSVNRIVASGSVTFVKRDPRTGAVEAEGGPFRQVSINTELQRLTIP